MERGESVGVSVEGKEGVYMWKWCGESVDGV